MIFIYGPGSCPEVGMGPWSQSSLCLLRGQDGEAGAAASGL